MFITIHGTPISQSRPRLSKWGVYDPNHADKKRYREYLENYRTEQIFEYPEISCIFYMPIPKGVRKKDLDLYNSGLLRHIKKPDIDNLVKFLLDVLDGIIIQDDQKVSLGFCLKLYDKNPRTVIMIEEKQRLISPQDIFY